MENTEVGTGTGIGTGTPPPALPGKKKARRASKKVAEKASRIVTATLNQRTVRVQFKEGGKVVFTSPEYKSRNTLEKIVAYARTQSKGKATGAKAIAQVPNASGRGWKTVTA